MTLFGLSLPVLAIAASVLAIIYALVLVWRVWSADRGDDKMYKIAKHIEEGANAFLKRQSMTVGVFAIIIFLLIAFLIQENGFFLASGFIVGAFFSMLSGYIGMSISVRANVRTAQAAKESLASALAMAFRGGSVTGFFVVGLALLGVSGFYYIFTNTFNLSLTETPLLLIGFGFGASLVSLFARVGGGIFTKAADVGADLVGKIEAGIPEDDPRNPAVIADNVGDNVGDCAGMGADLFETYAVTLIAGMILASQTIGSVESIEYPLLLGLIAIIASIFGSQFVRLGGGKNIMGAMYKGMLATGIFSAIGFYFATQWLFKGDTWLFVAALVGLLVTLFITIITEYYTSTAYGPVRSIAKASETGSGTNIITGLAVGLQSTWMPVILIVLAILGSYAAGMQSGLENGLYGIAVAAVAMLSTTGVVIATDSYGPITDNAGGIAEMANLPADVRKTTDALDAVGNTTKAVTKGYAISSAALAALVLFQAFGKELARGDETRAAVEAAIGYGSGGATVFDISNHMVLIGLFLGGLLPFVFSASCMSSVGKAAHAVVQEVRRQFKEIKGIMEGKAEPEYDTCVDIVARAALKEMIFPGLLAVLAPIIVGFVLGPQALGGLLAGVIIAGFLLALQMSNGGGAWDNAKKYIEEGHHGGKNSDAHRAAIVGDTVGDPFKDTAGPALNALIKVINTVALIIAPFIATWSLL